MSSYADIAAKGPKQSPEEAAAPQPPQVVPAESASSTISLVDVDSASVRTVPSDFLEQDIQTTTQSERIELEHEKDRAVREAKEAAAKAKAKAKETRDKAASKARQADSWLTRQFSDMSDGASSLLVVTNVLAVAGLSAFLGYRAWGLYEGGRLSWQKVGLGLGIVGAVGVVEGAFANYFQKGKGNKKQ